MKIERITLEGLPNTRDLGGYPAADGKKIRPHRLIRSGELINLTEADKKKLIQEYGLCSVVDFRTTAECTERPDPELPGVTNTHIQILDEGTLGLTREKKSDEDMLTSLMQQMQTDGITAEGYMERMYADFIDSEFARKQYRKFFELLLSQEEGAMLWHCTAGKDRAGVASMLVLEALGVPREIIEEDYLKVNEFVKETLDEQSALLREKRVPENVIACVREIFSVRSSYLASLYSEIERIYGSAGNFLEKEMGLDVAAVEKLRKMYLI